MEQTATQCSESTTRPPQRILRLVTVTGADDSVKPCDLWALARRFPYAEFGILLASEAGAGGGPRFPSRRWLTELVRVANDAAAVGKPMNLSGHICGEWVRWALEGLWPDAVAYDVAGIGHVFQRWQLNTHGLDHTVTKYAVRGNTGLLGARGQTVVFQLDGKAGNVAASMAVDAGRKNVAGLFDLSHGGGVLPEEWPKPMAGLACGYAGGLSPDNLAEQMPRIVAASGGAAQWVDTETALRCPGTDNGDYFDLELAEAFLVAAAQC